MLVEVLEGFLKLELFVMLFFLLYLDCIDLKVFR